MASGALRDRAGRGDQPRVRLIVLGARNPRSSSCWDRDEEELVGWARRHPSDELVVVA